MSHSQQCPQCQNALNIHFQAKQALMFATHWIKHAESVMADHGNHNQVSSGYKLREVPRMCIDCNTKRVGGSYIKCYRCRKTVNDTTNHVQSEQVISFSNSEPIVEEPIVRFTYED